MYPITVVDDFFSEPDKIVDYAMQQEFFPSENGRWPGKRSKFLWELDRTLYDDIWNINTIQKIAGGFMLIKVILNLVELSISTNIQKKILALVSTKKRKDGPVRFISV